MMEVNEFIEKLKLATSKKTLYVMGCFGSPLNNTNKERFTNIEHYSYNNNAERKKMIQNASSDTFGFDCVNLIKGILWGWTGDLNNAYGGAKYKTNDVPDVGANRMISLCETSTDFSNIEIGEAVWISGHIGVYIGDGKVIECSPKWNNGVQYSNLGNINKYKNGNYRIWTKHGKLPWVNYKKEENDWSKEARDWAVNNGIIKGYDNNDYGWGNVLTREELVVILKRFKEAYIK